MIPIPLIDVYDEGRFGGKAVSLGHALRAGLPVPNGFGLEVALVEALATAGDVPELVPAFTQLGGCVAIRSSAVGEDAKDASFAGQHVSVMNLCTVQETTEAVRDVWISARSAAALAYRQQHGIAGPPRIAAIMQKMVVPDCAGVLFTRDPLTGADERVVEAAWGLGEVIVAGLVIPDAFRISRDGSIKERRAGDKDVMLRVAPRGGTEQVHVDEALVTRLTLTDAQLGELHRLAELCENYYGQGLDIEWAIERSVLYLLQCRPITRG
jgi:pyruvate,water dikinase